MRGVEADVAETSTKGSTLSKAISFHLTAGQIAEFRREGFLVLRGLCSKADRAENRREGLLVQRMLEQAMAAWRECKDGFDPSKSWLQNSLLLNIHHHCPRYTCAY